MNEKADHNSIEYVEMTSGIVAAYVSHNSVSMTDIPKLITDIHGALKKLSSPPVPPAESQEVKPAVPVRKSIHTEHLVCLECGKSFKSIKRHLSSYHQTSPEAYREKFALPADYPMVAPAYSKKRSELAKNNGLGRKK